MHYIDYERLGRPIDHIGVNGKPYLDLEPHIDMSGIDEVIEEVVYFIASYRNMQLVCFSTGQELLPEYYQHLNFDPRRPKKTSKHPELNRSGNIILNSFYEPVLLFQQLIDLRMMEKPHKRHIEYADKCINTEAAERLSKTMAFINRLPLKEIGRVTLYHTLPGQECPGHCDYADPLGYDPQFIYLNPLKKPFYVIDSKGCEHIVDTRVAYFNLHDFHGMQRSYKSGFSIRVNGLWSDELKAATGTEEFFARGEDRRTRDFV